MWRVTLLLASIFCLIVPLFALAQEQQLSLDHALRLAYSDNSQMIEARSEIKAAIGRRWQAISLPELELELAIGGFKSKAGDSDKGLDSFAIRQPLDPLTTGFLDVGIARDEERIAKHQLALVWAHVREEVVDLYSMLLAEERAIKVAQDNLSATRQFFTRVENAYQSGSTTRADALRARLEVSEAENAVLVHERNLKSLKGQLNVALGSDYEKEFTLSDQLIYESLKYAYDQAMSSALDLRADLEQQKLQVSASQKRTLKERLSMVLPKFTLGVERTTTDDENDTALLIEASYPLGGLNVGAVKEAKANQVQETNRLKALNRQVRLEVYQAFLDAELGDRQVVLQKEALESANNLLRQITLEYEEGRASFLQYLENLKAIKATRLAYFDALRNYHVRVAALERVMQQVPIPEGVTE